MINLFKGKRTVGIHQNAPLQPSYIFDINSRIRSQPALRSPKMMDPAAVLTSRSLMKHNLSWKLLLISTWTFHRMPKRRIAHYASSIHAHLLSCFRGLRFCKQRSEKRWRALTKRFGVRSSYARDARKQPLGSCNCIWQFLSSCQNQKFSISFGLSRGGGQLLVGPPTSHCSWHTCIQKQRNSASL